MAAFPEMFPVSHATFRRALIRRFPFSIFYMIEKETIVVHAVLTTDRLRTRGRRQNEI